MSRLDLLGFLLSEAVLGATCQSLLLIVGEVALNECIGYRLFFGVAHAPVLTLYGLFDFLLLLLGTNLWALFLILYIIGFLDLEMKLVLLLIDRKLHLLNLVILFFDHFLNVAAGTSRRLQVSLVP